MAEGKIRNQVGEVGRPGLVSLEPRGLHPDPVRAPDIVVRMVAHKQDLLGWYSNLRCRRSKDPLLRLLAAEQIRNENT